MGDWAYKNWQIAPPAPDSFVEPLVRAGLHPVLAQVLYQRGMVTPGGALQFFNHYRKDDNPFKLKGMVEAVYRLRMAIRDNDPIAIYGDFDADGVTATVLLAEVLARLGAQVIPYIPYRVDEGYGLNSPALKHLADEGIKVVVSVDCGIRSIIEVENANSYGLDMIISDHHSIGPVVPEALAVINPKQADCPYPEKMLAGVGLAYKLAQGLYMESQRRGYRAEGWHTDDWLDLVAIGTVADIAPLQGENRELVERGLNRLHFPQRIGLQALYEVARIDAQQVTATTIGFQIGPRINAAGRLRSAMMAYELLTESDAQKAKLLAVELNNLNRERQEKTRQMQMQAEELIAGDPDEEPLLFAAHTEFEQGIVGLVASRLTEQYYRPSIVVQIGEDESHGSCRSIPEFHITHALEQCDGLLERYGGHAAAAGFTVQNENVEALQARMRDIAAQQLSEQKLIPSLEIDGTLRLDDVDLDMAEALESLEPTGEANPPPLFIVPSAPIAQRQAVGAEAQHLKLWLGNGDTRVEAIAFRWGEHMDTLPEVVDLACHLEINEWQGQRRLQLNVRDIRPPQS